MKRSFRRDLGELEAIFALVREHLAPDLPIADPFHVDLVLEELFTNRIKYGKGGTGPIEIELSRQEDRIRIVLVDRDAEDFDLTRAPEPDTEAPLEARPIGGLGLHFVRQVTEEFTYAHDSGVSTITLVLPLELRDGDATGGTGDEDETATRRAVEPDGNANEREGR